MKNHRPFVVFCVLLASLMAHAQNDTVVFSAKGGFYDDVFSLELFNIYPQKHIRYTINGNRPNAQSPLYEEPLLLDYKKYSKSNIYTIINCPEQDFFLPDSIQHCIVIRAAVFDENDSCVSSVITNSYFIRALGCDTHGLPVVSLCVDSLDLFDYEQGIFVPGAHYDSLNPYFTGNYFMKGREWERLCNIEFYELDVNTGVNQQVGLRTHGKSARWRSQKGMKLYARKEYGKKRIDYKFFDSTMVSSFKHLTLKPFTSSWSGCTDYLCNSLARHLDVECLDSRPAKMFINGEYWGIYYIQEKPDEHFLEDHLDIDINQVNIIENWITADCGDTANFNALYSWMEQADLGDEEQYAYAKAHIDIANALDYYILELFSNNLDWPSYNVRLWQEGEGPWRWIFFDGDGCLQNLDFDAFANATYEGDGSYPSSRRATLFFRRLLESKQFQEQFTIQFNQLAASVFSYQNSKPYFDFIKQSLQEEVPNQIARFIHPSSYETWENYYMWVVDRFLREKPMRVIEELNEFLSVENPEIVDFKCYPNPFSEEIRICVKTNEMGANEIAIYDLLGRKVFSMPFLSMSGTNEITLHPDLASGVYLLKICETTHRIVKVND